MKKVIAEMGGKNAIIVDDDADLDEAVSEVVASAFGYAGQKCSAASRVIVLEAVYDDFVRRLIEATRSLRVGPADDPGHARAAGDRRRGPRPDPRLHRDRPARRHARRRQSSRRRAAGPAAATSSRRTSSPTCGRTPPSPRRRSSGRCSPCIRAADIDEALAIANGVRFALTGGLFSRSPASIERARREFRVGNLYINRGITGALVERQPFGGFKMCGVGSKAGGPDYLLQFMEPRVITENTMRRGFAPPEDLLEEL